MRAAFPASDGVRLSYVEDGAGPVVVLLHGATASATSNWVETAWWPHLRSEFRLLALDLRGHGESEMPGSAQGMQRDRLAMDVVELLEDAEVPRACLLGYSAGAGLALRVAQAHPDRVVGVAAGGLGAGAVAVAGVSATDDVPATVEHLRRLAAYLEGRPQPGASAGGAVIRANSNDLSPNFAFPVSTLLWLGRKDSALGAYSAVETTARLAAMDGPVERELFDGDHLTVMAQDAARKTVVEWLRLHAHQNVRD